MPIWLCCLMPFSFCSTLKWRCYLVPVLTPLTFPSYCLLPNSLPHFIACIWTNGKLLIYSFIAIPSLHVLTWYHQAMQWFLDIPLIQTSKFTCERLNAWLSEYSKWSCKRCFGGVPSTLPPRHLLMDQSYVLVFGYYLPVRPFWLSFKK